MTTTKKTGKQTPKKQTTKQPPKENGKITKIAGGLTAAVIEKIAGKVADNMKKKKKRYKKNPLDFSNKLTAKEVTEKVKPILEKEKIVVSGFLKNPKGFRLVIKGFGTKTDANKFLKTEKLENGKVHLKTAKRRNGVTKLEKLYQEFLGRGVDGLEVMKGSNDFPNALAVIGWEVPKIEFRNADGQEFDALFNIEPPQLATDGKSLFLIRGSDDHKRQLQETAANAKVLKLHYVVAKSHIGGGKTYEYFHFLGEESGKLPSLKFLQDGTPKVTGGGFYFTPEGIRD